MTARFDPDILVVFGADFAQLERGAHFAVQFILLLRHLDVILGSGGHRPAKIRIHAPAIRIQITIYNIYIIINLNTETTKKKEEPK